MARMEINNIRDAIFNLLHEVKEDMGISDELTMDTEPTAFGIRSQILVSVIGRLQNRLRTPIPLNCYPFYDKTSRKKLTLNEASIKLMKIIKKNESKRILLQA